MADAHEWIDTVIKRAADLRAAGVTTVTVDGCSVTLAPPEAVEPVDVKPTIEDDPRGPLYSAATYPNGAVPGFTREGES